MNQLYVLSFNGLSFLSKLLYFVFTQYFNFRNICIFTHTTPLYQIHKNWDQGAQQITITCFQNNNGNRLRNGGVQKEGDVKAPL